jgi:hypothetical protein
MLFWIGWICFGLFVCAAGLLAAAIYRPYRHYRTSPERAWRLRVLSLIDDVTREIQRTEAELQQHGGYDSSEADDLREKAFLQQLEQIPIEVLDAYPNIGPVTIERLREAGFKSMAGIRDKPVQIVGLGEKRLSDVGSAVRAVIKQEWSQLMAGANPEGRELAEQLRALQIRASEEAYCSHGRLEALKHFLAELGPFKVRAEELDFWGYVGLTSRNIATPSYVREPLPDWREVVARANEAARKEYAAQGKPSPAPFSVDVASPAAPEFADTLSNHPGKVFAPAAKTRTRPGNDLFREALEGAPTPKPVAPASFVPPKKRPAPSPVKEQKIVAQAVSPPVAKPEPQPAPPKPSRADHLKVLEIDPTVAVSVDLVRRQYNLLTERYDPEKFAVTGADFVAMAQGKREAVRLAATALLETFGETVEIPKEAQAKEELRHNPDLDAVFGA